MTIPTSFAPGNVIQARRRLWRVDARQGDVLTATAIDGQTDQVQFYIPFENIRAGELPLPSPERVGSYQAQQLLLRAYRLSMLHGTAPLLSLQRSRVIPKDYQLVPVVMALELPRVRLLLADDVGLGKTIEAGLILTELMARQLARRVLIIVPANLREQWREALDYFFHISPRIISTRHRREMERELPAGTNPWEAYPVLITSVDYAKQPAIKNQILEVGWDAVLVDEAHQVAKPHQASPDQRVKMDRHDLADLLARCDNELERDVLREINRRGLPLPDEIQKVIYDGSAPVAQADFFYAPNLLIFVDGPAHDQDHARTADANTRRRLRQLNFRPLVIRYDDRNAGLNELGRRLER